MHEMDDRLAGDAVWELFAQPDAHPVGAHVQGPIPMRWVAAGSLIGVGLLLFPPLAVATACLAIALDDFRAGHTVSRSIPDKAGGKVCARFRHAWGAWKIGAAGFAMFLSAIVLFAPGKPADPPSAFMAAVLCWLGGFVLSAAWTCWGMATAWRSGMRVWIGEGVNRARILLMSMLIVSFTLTVLIPLCVILAAMPTRVADGSGGEASVLLLLYLSMFAGPLGIVLLLDAIARRVVADRPGKFGPKVPTVGKWYS